MPYRRTTFSKFVIEDLRRKGSDHDPELAALLNDLQRAGKLIGAAVARGALDSPGSLVTTTVVVPGEPPKPFCDVANAIMLSATRVGRPAVWPSLLRRPGALRDPRAISARPLHAGVLAAGRCEEPRCRSDRGHDLLGSARTGRRHQTRPRRIFCSLAGSRWPPATRCSGPSA